MKYIMALLITFNLIFLSCSAQNRPEAEPDLVIENVSIVNVAEGKLIPNQSVEITGNIISGISSIYSGDRSSLRIIDGSDKFIIPGLWDMHVHALWQGRAQSFMKLFTVYGITGFRDMWGDLELAEELRKSNDVLPRFILAGNLIDGAKLWQFADIAETPEEGRDLVESYAANGSDFIKVYTKLSRDVYMEIAETSKEIGIPFAGHVPLSITAAEASNMGQKSFEHLTGVMFSCTDKRDDLRKLGYVFRAMPLKIHDNYNPDKCRELMDILADNNTWQVPTLVIQGSRITASDSWLQKENAYDFVLPGVEQRWKSLAERYRNSDDGPRKKLWDVLLKVVGQMNEAGVPILAGSDISNPFIRTGLGLHEELQYLVEAGLSPAEALKTATLNPALFTGMSNRLGTVESGKLADLVILDDNPLEDIANTLKINAVIQDGHLFTRNQLELMKESVKEEYQNLKSD